MPHIVAAVPAGSAEPHLLRTVISQHVAYERCRRQRAVTARRCAIAGAIAVACWRSGLWPAASAGLVVALTAVCAVAISIEWRARGRLDRLLDAVGATRTVLPRTDSPPMAP